MSTHFLPAIGTNKSFFDSHAFKLRPRSPSNENVTSVVQGIINPKQEVTDAAAAYKNFIEVATKTGQFTDDAVVYNSFIEVATKAGQFEEAQKVFDQAIQQKKSQPSDENLFLAAENKLV
ncbi:MAG: hypothetical protein WA678_03995 [Rhabdochlamydiaceae bacterium]